MKRFWIIHMTLWRKRIPFPFENKRVIFYVYGKGQSFIPSPNVGGGALIKVYS
jgi:hypothetical protein